MIELTLPADLSARVTNSEIALVRDIGQILEDLGKLRILVDRSFRCREIPRPVFDVKLMHCRTTREINTLYWRDMASSIKAYSLSTTWRVIELVENLIVLLHQGGVLGPAIISRSLIELAVAYITNGGAIRELVSSGTTSWDENVIISQDLEILLNKALYGTRLAPEGDSLRQTNVLTQIQKLSKSQGFEHVELSYKRLCEVAHPNMAGNARFWADSVKIEKDGTLLRTGGRSMRNQAIGQLQDDMIWALAWSSANGLMGFQILNAQVETIRLAFPSSSDAAP